MVTLLRRKQNAMSNIGFNIADKVDIAVGNLIKLCVCGNETEQKSNDTQNELKNSVTVKKIM